MDQIITTIISSLCIIITTVTALICAYLNKKTKQLEENKLKIEKEKEALKSEVKSLHNGFREYVYRELLDIKSKVEHLEDVKVCKRCKRKKDV